MVLLWTVCLLAPPNFPLAHSDMRMPTFGVNGEMRALLRPSLLLLPIDYRGLQDQVYQYC